MSQVNQIVSMRLGARSSSSPPIVFVIDEDPAVRHTVESAALGAGWQPRAFASATEFLAQPRIMTPGCLILDVALPDLSGLEVQRLVADRPELPIVFLTAVREVSTTVQAMRAGAVEFLTKPCISQILVRAIEHAVNRSRQALAEETGRCALRERYAALSPREREVMGWVIAGLLNKQIAGELGISEITVKAHRGKLMRKMVARSVAELVTMALRLQLTPDVNRSRRRTAETAEKSGWLPRFDQRPRRAAILGEPAATGAIA